MDKNIEKLNSWIDHPPFEEDEDYYGPTKLSIEMALKLYEKIENKETFSIQADGDYGVTFASPSIIYHVNESNDEKYWIIVFNDSRKCIRNEEIKL